jgi:hypothetical protein
MTKSITLKPILTAASVAILLLTTSCAGTPDQYKKRTSESVAKEVEIKTSEFDKTINIEGPRIWDDIGVSATSGFIVMPRRIMKLRGWIDKKTNKSDHQLYISQSYDDLTNSSWANFSAATDDKAKEFSLKKVDYDANCKSNSLSYQIDCSRSEDVAIDITEPYLKSRKDSGLKFKIHGQGGTDVIVEVPSNYVNGYLLAIQNYKSQNK